MIHAVTDKAVIRLRLTGYKLWEGLPEYIPETYNTRREKDRIRIANRLFRPCIEEFQQG
ncbi:hypothetical protein JW979_04640 [bacterium]|nr:hypothetical protein [candidate division CSSED10-310 bacterium]